MYCSRIPLELAVLYERTRFVKYPISSRFHILTVIGLKQHKFKQPAKPLEPPTPRTSVLGLDRLAKEKRTAAALNDGNRKKPRFDSGEPLFKGTSHFHRKSFILVFSCGCSSCITTFSCKEHATKRRGNAISSWRPIRSRKETIRRA
jgi:hypothetical protein